MHDASQQLLRAFDGHAIDGVREAIEAGADVRAPINGKPPVEWLLQQYTRSDRLPDCLRLLLERGARFSDERITAVLLDDADGVRAAIKKNPALLSHRATLVSSFTSLVDVSLLHVAAEYGNLRAARALIELGADVNDVAGKDEYGFNGHTPLFHTVNSNGNRSASIMQLFLDSGANVSIRLSGIHWGKGYPWETVFFDVTPISYAQLGLMPQVHRNEKEIYANVHCLIEASGRKMPPLNNVPNNYLLVK